MPYGKTPMKKKGSMMYMGHDSAAKMYGSKSAIKMDHDSPMKAGHSPMKAGHSPMKAGHSPMKKRGGHAIHKHMSNSAFMKKDGVMDADTEDMPLEKDTTGGRKGSMVQMSYSPMKKYDRVVLGGNKGDKSKTKPGKKDFMQ